MTTDRDVATKKEWGESRIAFLAQVDEIRRLLELGWPVTRIHRELHEHLGGMPYQVFWRHVRKHFGRQRDEDQRRGQRGRAREAARATAAAAPATAGDTGGGGAGPPSPSRPVSRWAPAVRGDPAPVAEDPKLSRDDATAAFRKRNPNPGKGS